MDKLKADLCTKIDSLVDLEGNLRSHIPAILLLYFGHIHYVRTYIYSDPNIDRRGCVRRGDHRKKSGRLATNVEDFGLGILALI